MSTQVGGYPVDGSNSNLNIKCSTGFVSDLDEGLLFSNCLTKRYGLLLYAMSS